MNTYITYHRRFECQQWFNTDFRDVLIGISGLGFCSHERSSHSSALWELLSSQAPAHPIMPFSCKLTKRTSQHGKRWCYSNTDLLISHCVSAQPALSTLFSFFLSFFFKITSCFQLSAESNLTPSLIMSKNGVRSCQALLAVGMYVCACCRLLAWNAEMGPEDVYGLEQRVRVQHH